MGAATLHSCRSTPSARYTFRHAQAIRPLGVCSMQGGQSGQLRNALTAASSGGGKKLGCMALSERTSVSPSMDEGLNEDFSNPTMPSGLQRHHLCQQRLTGPIRANSMGRQTLAKKHGVLDDWFREGASFSCTVPVWWIVKMRWLLSLVGAF